MHACPSAGKSQDYCSQDREYIKITVIKSPQISKIHQEYPPLFGGPSNRKHNKWKDKVSKYEAKMWPPVSNEKK